jgi:nitrite reductase/ring-hydroxylating ferredoxin subunit
MEPKTDDSGSLAEAVAARSDERDFAVCPVDELPPGSMKLVPIGKFGVGVYNVGGDYYAITNYCPHEGGPLCLGRVQGTTEARPDLPSRTGYVLEGRVLRCPWHQWEFDLSSGTTIAKPEKRIRTYEVRIDDGMVIVKR